MLKIGEAFKNLIKDLIKEEVKVKRISQTINPGSSAIFTDLIGATEVSLLFLGSPTDNRAVMVTPPELINNSRLRLISGDYEFIAIVNRVNGEVTNSASSTAPITAIIYR